LVDATLLDHDGLWKWDETSGRMRGKANSSVDVVDEGIAGMDTERKYVFDDL
jgi:hypothetical protein